ncbi:MAG: RNase adapter RapZ [Acidimicrobiaceae bacterium]|nr:RNase adapter RapZ [Acidimicrobiaceae bacterium]
MSDLVVIAGVSGAGRTVAADNLEDMGWFVMDNLPPALIPKVAELADGSSAAGDRMALVVGSGQHQDKIASLVSALRSKFTRVQLVFLDASTEVLVRRYESSRRRHPFDDDQSGRGGTLGEIINAERVALEPLRALADLVIDTSDLNVHQLRDRMTGAFGDGNCRHTMQTTVSSFGYKHGLPIDVDLVIDCRFLPNPHWIEELRPLTGLDRPVFEYVLSQPVTDGFLERLKKLLELLLPLYEQEGKSYLTVAFGCTGGRHRSVAIAERMAVVLEELGVPPSVVHRDISI